MALSINKNNYYPSIDGVVHNVTNQVDGLNVELQQLLDNDNYLADKKANKADVVDNLDTPEAEKILSARMGYKINNEKMAKSGDFMTGNLSMNNKSVVLSENRVGTKVHLVGIVDENTVVGSSHIPLSLVSSDNPTVTISNQKFKIFSENNLVPANFINRNGDTMLGPLSFQSSAVKIESAGEKMTISAPNNIRFLCGNNDIEIIKYGATHKLWDSYNFKPEDKLNVDANAVSATKLRTSRTINGVAFDGTKSITITANPNYHTHTDAEIPCPYGVGDVLTTTSATHPAERWVGTTWRKIEGRFLLGTKGAEISKATGGATSITLSSSQIPSHSHSVSITSSSDGIHNHTASSSSTAGGSHSHTVGSHRHKVDSHSHSQPEHNHIQGKTERGSGVQFGTSGTHGLDSFEHHKWHNSVGRALTSSAGGDTTGASAPYTDYQEPGTTSAGSHSHTITTTIGNSVGHTHTVSGNTGSTGSGSAIDITPAYYKVHYWERIS